VARLAPTAGDKAGKDVADRRLAITLAVLLIIQLLTAAVGNFVVQAYIDGDASRTALTIGVLLMMFSGIVIAVIGVLLYVVLRSTNRRSATSILVLRSMECVVAAVFGVYLLMNLQTVPNHLLWVYLLAGAGGVVFTYVLYRSKMVPRPIAALGFIGYALLLLAVPLDLAGVLDTDAGVGQAVFVPGGLFELIVLPTWLFAKGFNVAGTTSRLLRQMPDRGERLVTGTG
jgi:hypothetical protein